MSRVAKREAPIVAELGRAETPDETAARKAESSRVYRSSQTVRNLIAALLVTLAVVAVIVVAVPRGEPASPPSVDLKGIATDVADTMGTEVIVPDVGAGWRANRAQLDGGATVVWNVTLAPTGEDERGFIRVAQAFDASTTWAPQALDGFAPTGVENIEGLDWDVYDIGDRGDRNIRYALGTQAGDDYVLLYGASSAEATAALASSLAPQITRMQEVG